MSSQKWRYINSCITIIINIIIIIIIIIIIYFYGLRDTFEVDTDHKPLLSLFASHKVTAPLQIERMRVRLQGCDYKLNYVPGKKAKAETNEADYNSRHPEPITRCKRHRDQMQYHRMSCYRRQFRTRNSKSLTVR